VLLFLVPPMRRAWTSVLAWIGGALFTAKLLLNPFGAAKFTYLMTEKGPIRRLPVELTMANDLPVMLAQPLRGRVHYQNGPDAVFLYFLDQNAWPPEPVEKNANGSTVYAMWVSGAGRADIIVRAAFPIQRLAIEADSPIRTVLSVAAGREPMTITLDPHKPVAFDVWTSGVQGFHDYDYLMTIRSTEGFVPHLLDPQSADYRNLGAKLRFSAIRPVAP
jgi:hypothetical protein